MQIVKKKASVLNLVLFAASDIIQCCFSVENQETLQRSLFLISSLNNWHSWVLFCFSSTYFSEMIWSTLIISALISPQSQSPVYSWLLDSYSDGPQIPSLSKILKLNSSSTLTFLLPFNLNGPVFYLSSIYRNLPGRLSNETRQATFDPSSVIPSMKPTNFASRKMFFLFL